MNRFTLVTDVLSKFMNSCTKLEELHVGRLSTPSIFFMEEPVHEAYRCIAKQQHLKKLTLNWLEFTHGTFLQQVVIHHEMHCVDAN